MKLLIKAYGRKDISKLIPKVITNIKGQQMTVYVRPEEEEMSSKLTHEELVDKAVSNWKETLDTVKDLKSQVKILEDNQDKLEFSINELYGVSDKIGEFQKETKNFLLKIKNEEWQTPEKYKNAVAFLMSKVSSNIAAQATEILEEGRKKYTRRTIEAEVKKALDGNDTNKKPEDKKMNMLLRNFKDTLDKVTYKMKHISKGIV